MKTSQPAVPPAAEPVPEGDVVAMLVMIDYLIAEIGRIDLMAAQCLKLARKSLTEAAADAFIKTH